MLHIQWQLNGNDIPGATSPVLDITEGGTYTIVINSSSCSTTDTITINVIPEAKVDLPNILCLENETTIDGTLTNAGEFTNIEYTWKDAYGECTF